MKKRRKFDREYKQMVVELANARENISALAVELDLRVDLIYRWRREALANLGASFPVQGNKLMTEGQKEIALLKKELRDARLERDILKKAVSVFSRSDGKYSNSYGQITAYFPLTEVSNMPAMSLQISSPGTKMLKEA